MAESQVSSRGVYRSGVFIKGDVCLGNAEVVGCPVNLGDGVVWEAFPDFFRIERCRRDGVGVAGWWELEV